MNWLDPTCFPLQVPGVPTLHGGEVFASSGHRYNYDTFHGASSRASDLRGNCHIFRGSRRIRHLLLSSPAPVRPELVPGVIRASISRPSGFPRSTMASFCRERNLAILSRHRVPSCRWATSLGAANDIGFDAVGPIPASATTFPTNRPGVWASSSSCPGRSWRRQLCWEKGTHLYLGGFRDSNRLPAAVKS